MKERSTKIELPVYGYLIYVVVTDDIIGSRNQRSNSLGGVFAGTKQPDGLHSTNDDDPFSYIFLNPGCTPGLVAHECYHIVCKIMAWIGASHEEGVMAYHLGYLVNEVETFLKRK